MVLRTMAARRQEVSEALGSQSWPEGINPGGWSADKGAKVAMAAECTQEPSAQITASFSSAVSGGLQCCKYSQ